MYTDMHVTHRAHEAAWSREFVGFTLTNVNDNQHHTVVSGDMVAPLTAMNPTRPQSSPCSHTPPPAKPSDWQDPGAKGDTAALMELYDETESNSVNLWHGVGAVRARTVSTDSGTLPLSVQKFQERLEEQERRFGSMLYRHSNDDRSYHNSRHTQSITVLPEGPQVPMEELDIGKEFGRGSMKRVRHGKWCGTPVAIALVDQGGLALEAAIQQSLPAHPNLIQHYGCSKIEGLDALVMEFAEYGSLETLLRQCSQSDFMFTTKAKVDMCQQMAAGLAEFASNKLVHRDVAARNVLVHRVYPVHVKVCDYGLACRPEDLPSPDTAKLPLRWTPPECFGENPKWSEKSDVWSFGVAMWEIFSDAREPYGPMLDREVKDNVSRGGQLPCPAEMCEDFARSLQGHQHRQEFSDKIYLLMQSCWLEPENRASFYAIRQTLATISAELDVVSQAVPEASPAVTSSLFCRTPLEPSIVSHNSGQVSHYSHQCTEEASVRGDDSLSDAKLASQSSLQSHMQPDCYSPRATVQFATGLTPSLNPLASTSSGPLGTAFNAVKANRFTTLGTASNPVGANMSTEEVMEDARARHQIIPLTTPQKVGDPTRPRRPPPSESAARTEVTFGHNIQLRAEGSECLDGDDSYANLEDSECHLLHSNPLGDSQDLRGETLDSPRDTSTPSFEFPKSENVREEVIQPMPEKADVGSRTSSFAESTNANGDPRDGAAFHDFAPLAHFKTHPTDGELLGKAFQPSRSAAGAHFGPASAHMTHAHASSGIPCPRVWHRTSSQRPVHAFSSYVDRNAPGPTPTQSLHPQLGARHNTSRALHNSLTLPRTHHTDTTSISQSNSNLREIDSSELHLDCHIPVRSPSHPLSAKPTSDYHTSANISTTQSTDLDNHPFSIHHPPLQPVYHDADIEARSISSQPLPRPTTYHQPRLVDLVLAMTAANHAAQRGLSAPISSVGPWLRTLDMSECSFNTTNDLRAPSTDRYLTYTSRPGSPSFQYKPCESPFPHVITRYASRPHSAPRSPGSPRSPSIIPVPRRKTEPARYYRRSRPRLSNLYPKSGSTMTHGFTHPPAMKKLHRPYSHSRKQRAPTTQAPSCSAPENAATLVQPATSPTRDSPRNVAASDQQQTEATMKRITAIIRDRASIGRMQPNSAEQVFHAQLVQGLEQTNGCNKRTCSWDSGSIQCPSPRPVAAADESTIMVLDSDVSSGTSTALSATKNGSIQSFVAVAAAPPQLQPPAPTKPSNATMDRLLNFMKVTLSGSHRDVLLDSLQEIGLQLTPPPESIPNISPGHRVPANAVVNQLPPLSQERYTRLGDIMPSPVPTSNQYNTSVAMNLVERTSYHPNQPGRTCHHAAGLWKNVDLDETFFAPTIIQNRKGQHPSFPRGQHPSESPMIDQQRRQHSDPNSTRMVSHLSGLEPPLHKFHSQPPSAPKAHYMVTNACPPVRLSPESRATPSKYEPVTHLDCTTSTLQDTHSMYPSNQKTSTDTTCQLESSRSLSLLDGKVNRSRAHPSDYNDSSCSSSPPHQSNLDAYEVTATQQTRLTIRHVPAYVPVESGAQLSHPPSQPHRLHESDREYGSIITSASVPTFVDVPARDIKIQTWPLLEAMKRTSDESESGDPDLDPSLDADSSEWQGPDQAVAAAPQTKNRAGLGRIKKFFGKSKKDKEREKDRVAVERQGLNTGEPTRGTGLFNRAAWGKNMGPR